MNFYFNQPTPPRSQAEGLAEYALQFFPDRGGPGKDSNF
jgi:hypothetical protein